MVSDASPGAADPKMNRSFVHIAQTADVFNSLTAKSVLKGTKNSRSEGFLLAKHKHTNIPHHDGAISLSSGMVLMDEHTPPPGVSLQGVGRGRRCTVLIKSQK